LSTSVRLLNLLALPGTDVIIVAWLRRRNS